ncbi:MAG: 50S ribosomal protein L11 methyltransferase [Halioglobus sp.]|nr:50S ribosomal protein L11 methyltransferase [Halioglobus sp.]
MSWLQLRLDVAPDAVADLENALLAAGAVAVTLEDNADQPLLEPGVGETPLWQETRLTGLFAADAEMDTVLRNLPVDDSARARVEILEDKDWEREWMQHYQPMQFGPRLWVCPSWLEPPEPDSINLLLDPGLAFGTGTHPTTALCLAELDALDPAGKTVVDFGCGSGILAVAALKLGAERALGIDNDPQALRASRDNARRNGLPDAALPVALPGDNIEQEYVGRADIVVANILAGPLVALSDKLLAFLAPGGTLLLSGLLATQADELCGHYANRVSLTVAGEHDGWVCLQGKS